MSVCPANVVTLTEGLWGGAKGETWGWAGHMDPQGKPLSFNFPYRLFMKRAWDCLEENQDPPVEPQPWPLLLCIWGTPCRASREVLQPGL